MKQRLILFACALALLGAAFTACGNQEITTLLRAPSELRSLEVVAFAGDTLLEGGAAMEPGFTSSIFDYTVFVSKDTDRFTVSANLNGKGTIEIMCEEDQETGTEFDYLDDEKVVILTVEREYMEVAEYRVTVLREEAVPTATGVEIRVTPEIGAFFMGSGVIPEFEVTANLPAAGGELSYQWYVNTENSNRGGSRINGATGTTYRMRQPETMIARTAYYYAEITNTIDGKTGVTETLPCRVTFLDKKEELHEKSLAMVDIPAGEVTQNIIDAGYWSYDTWNTPGFSIGQYLVTWELWKFVFDYAEAGNYSFVNVGNQGADYYTVVNQRPIGNERNPVTLISWRDVVVWCNAYSEMDGREPVYRDKDGNVLRSSRVNVEQLVDESKMAGKNGYRLPAAEEWEYAGRGAQPGTNAPWTYNLPGINNLNPSNQAVNANNWRTVGEYLWSRALTNDVTINYDERTTIEVGSLKPNSIELYDMMGMTLQFVWFSHIYPDPDDRSFTWVYGNSFAEDVFNFGEGSNHRLVSFVANYMSTGLGVLGVFSTGLRVACSEGEQGTVSSEQ
jgi:formylglycine-generating enzyme required for sulfatase activity